MRTCKATLLLLVVFFLVAPAPAQAWWGWLDELSGPGKFRGLEFDFRLVCFGEPSGMRHLAELVNEAKALSRLAVSTDPLLVNKPSIDEVKNAWRLVLAELGRTNVRFPIFESADVLKAAHDIETLTVDDLKQFTSKQGQKPPAGSSKTQSVTGSTTPRGQDAEKAIETATASANSAYAANLSIGSTGVFWSACSNNKERRSSIEVGANFWHADPNPAFAHNEQILLNTLMAFYSFRVFQDPRFDFLDAGVGGGVYWFSSKGFQSFSGVILQPGRFDFHAPTVWTKYPLTDVRRWAALPTFRLGWMMFPSGFEADAFSKSGTPERIPAELVPTWTIFVNLEPLLRRAVH